MRVEREVVLPSSAVDSWRVLTDWERQADWMRDVDRVDVVSMQRQGVGVVLDAQTRVLGVPLFTDRLEIVAWDPPRTLEVAHRRFVHGRGEWRLEPVAGGTRFIWTERVSLPIPILGELLLGLYRPIMRFLMGRALEGLRRSMVSDAGGSPGGHD